MMLAGAFLLLGAVAGLLAGLLGVGGGLVIVPVLAWLFETHLAGAPVMHLALGTSLATIVFTSLASMRAHRRRGAVDMAVVWRITPGILIGGWLGAMLAGYLDTGMLRVVFGVFELLVALQMGFGLRPAPHRCLPGPAGITLAGLVIGAVSAIVGIGGGTLTVPFLVWCGVTMTRAVGTSAAIGLPIALAGSIGYIVAGLGKPLPAWTSGYVYWPAVAGIVAASMLFAPLGARLAHWMPAVALKRVFALLLAILGLRMLLA